MKEQLIKLANKRRSIYDLGRRVTQSQNDITSLIENSIRVAPTAFNNQTTCAVILFNKRHEQLWDIVIDQLKSKIPNKKNYQRALQKIKNFKSAFGTILFFTDMDIVHQYELNKPLYADNFADWAEQGQGYATFVVWTALAENGIGANLQHYNPLIDAQVSKEFNIAESWKLRAQMDFGSIESTAAKKEFMDNDNRFKVLK